MFRQYFIVVIANLSVLTTGMSVGWPSPMLVKLTSELETPLSRVPTEVDVSWIVSLGYLLAIISNFLGGVCLDLLGRKPCIIACSVPKLGMAVLLIFSTEVWMVLLARTVMVMTDSFVLVVIPVYVTEIASKELRGSLGSATAVFSAVGILITLSVGPFVSYHTYSYIICSAIAVTTLPLFFLPETPYYQISQGKTDSALKTMMSIRHSEAEAKAELDEFRKSVEEHVEIDKLALFKDKTFVKSILLSALLCGASQMIGYNAVNFYLQTILISTNTNVKPEIASVIVSVIQVISTFCVTFLTSIFRRKHLLFFSLTGILLGMLGLGTFFQVMDSDNKVTGFMNYLPIISIILVVCCYNSGFGALMFPMTAELFEGPTRAFGFNFGLGFGLFAVFLSTKFFPIIASAFGPAVTYWFFSIMCVIIGVLIMLFLPETKDKTFREIQLSLGKKDDVEKKCSP